MKFFLLLFLFLLTFFTEALKGQSLLSGSVKDESGQALPFTNILLLNPVDSSLKTGTVTNEQGIFHFENLSSGSYLLKASIIGYEIFFTP